MFDLTGFIRRYTALVKKETHQMLRDKSNLMVGLLLPAALILLFGYGLSFDVSNAPVAVVLDNPTPTAQNVLSGMQGSKYLNPIRVGDFQTAETLLENGKVDAIVRLPSDFDERLKAGNAQVQLILNGVDATTGQTVEGYVNGAIAMWAQHALDRSGVSGGSGVTIVQRMWFNEASISTWYLVPGLLVLVLTLIGAFLTSLLIAREWERGTLESLFVTPVRPMEIALAKLTPYVFVGMIDVAVCLGMSYWLFEVPMRGSLGVIVLSSMLYLLVSLCTGLVISGITRNQFQASQIAMMAGFMPAMMLSGFVFDIRNMSAVMQTISYALPATYFMELVKMLFLGGNYWPMIVKNCLILAAYAAALVWLSARMLRKKLD
ncbi:ABC transporter permease [Neisseria perflava]|uniref:ABC transporter permease n=1 Tax=Neisseria perflava TaxID=33053 RepID=UPI0020A0B1E0|nr:ABC transporter permease [Neisseria perflava]MCP1659401.1 ABC-2 type transport system permease protein [Neisseria perflava]MCP1772156.1 ABC-2 type transport system permease protein [Neisseria perflava]